jgi:ferredoxin-NADP reductase
MNNEFLVQILRRTLIANNTYELTLSLNDEFNFLPGQYIWLIVPRLTVPDLRGEQRAFSITTSNKLKNELSVIYRISDSGYKKTLQGIPVGSTVKIRGPHGSSYVSELFQDKDIVLIAGGNGISPFLSILRSYDRSRSDIRYTLIYSNASAETGVFLDELKQITAELAIPFTNHLGSFDPSVLPDSIDYQNSTFYICGPEGFVDGVYKTLKEKNVRFEQMHFEQHYPTKGGTLTENDFKEKHGVENVMLQAVQDSKNHVIITNANGLIIFANKTAQKKYRFYLR